VIATAVRAIAKAQNALCAEPKLAAEVGWRKFPPEAAALITRVVERDATCYGSVRLRGCGGWHEPLSANKSPRSIIENCGSYD
jgi:hypothetical protein